MRSIRILVVCLLTVVPCRAAGPTQEAQPVPESVAVQEAASLERPTTFVVELESSERAAANAGRAVERNLLRGLRTFDWERCGQAFSPGFRGRFPGPDSGLPVADAGLELALFEGAEATQSEWMDAQGLLAVLRAHVEGWSLVERAELKFFEFLLEPGGERAFGSAHFTLAGPRVSAGRVELHAVLELVLVPDERGKWRIQGLDWIRGHRAASEEPLFVDVSDSVGFHFNQSAANRELSLDFIDDMQMLSVGGVNVIDWNADGFWDVLATRRDQISVLFQNDGEGGFTREPLPLRVPQDSGQAFLFVDLDGDGLEELISSQVLGYDGERAWAGLYTRKQGEWRHLERAFEFAIPRGVRSISVAGLVPQDVDGDGALDLFFCVHSDSRSGREAYNSYAAFDGGDNLLFMNRGELAFSEESDARGIEGRQYTFVAHFFDFDGDGDADLVEGNDYGPNWYYQNDGEGQFVRRPEHPLSGQSSYTMGLTLADFDNTGDWSLHLSNMYSHAGNRIAPLARSLSPELRSKVQAMGMGNELYTLDSKTGEWFERGQDFAINDSGWAWASVFFDFDNDGDGDLFAVNGNTSNRDEAAPDW